jgi:hypothetical protein
MAEPAGGADPGESGGGSAAEGRALFLACAGFALLLHAGLLLSAEGLRAGEDVVPHLRLIVATRLTPGLHNVYAPFYHFLGAALEPLVGLAAYPRLFSFASAVALVFAFRAFQLAAGLPATSAALFAFSPYVLTVSWCIPKVEFMGHAVGLLGLAALLRRRYLALGLAVFAAFLVHTAATLVFGFAAGILALARRDLRALVTLALGSSASLPLFAAHLAAGCTLPQAFQFSGTGYLWKGEGLDAVQALWIFCLASPLALAAGIAGAPALWRRSRPVALMALGLLFFYLNDLWLLPFGAYTAGGLYRGLSVLTIPVAIAAGVAAATWPPAWGRALLLACGLWAAAAALWIVPDSCYVRAIDVAEARSTRVQRCEFAWSNARRPGRAAPGFPADRPRQGRRLPRPAP